MSRAQPLPVALCRATLVSSFESFAIMRLSRCQYFSLCHSFLFLFNSLSLSLSFFLFLPHVSSCLSSLLSYSFYCARWYRFASTSSRFDSPRFSDLAQQRGTGSRTNTRATQPRAKVFPIQSRLSSSRRDRIDFSLLQVNKWFNIYLATRVNDTTNINDKLISIIQWKFIYFKCKIIGINKVTSISKIGNNDLIKKKDTENDDIEISGTFEQ